MLRKLASGVLGASSVTLLLVACSGAVTIGENGSGSTASHADGSCSNDCEGKGGGSESPQDASVDSPTSDSSKDGSVPVDGGPTDCVGCTTSQICVAHRTVGGALVTPDDAGVCPPGRHVELLPGGDPICQNDWAYSCEDRPAGCAGVVDCTCAGTYCGDHGLGSGCSVRTGTLSDLECVFAAP
jgi:hypothetical protein